MPHTNPLHPFARAPSRREARDAYDALEQARVEIVGGQHMAGVASNLRARLAEECEAEGYDRMTRKDGAWRIAHRTVVFEVFRGQPAPAGGGLSDRWALSRRDGNDPIEVALRG